MLKETKLNIGYIGIGNAGSQIGIEAFKAGIPIRLINTSSKDLDDSIIPEGAEDYLPSESFHSSCSTSQKNRIS